MSRLIGVRWIRCWASAPRRFRRYLPDAFREEHGQAVAVPSRERALAVREAEVHLRDAAGMVENRYVRYGVKTVARRMNNLSGYFQLYGVPLSYLPKLDVCEKRNIYAPGGIPGSTSIFDLLQDGGKSYKTYCYHDGTDDELLASDRGGFARRAGEILFPLPRRARLFSASARRRPRGRGGDPGKIFGPRSRACTRSRSKTYGAADIHVFGDHGMAPTDGDHRYPGECWRRCR